MTGVKSVNFDQASFVDEIIGHRDGSLVRAPASLVRAQFAAEPLGPNCQNRADLYADLAWADGATATVWGDATEAWRGVYRKSGASGAGSWARIGDLPMSSASSAQLNAKADAAAVAAALDGKATAAQGARADTAVQPGADVSVLVETADAKILTAAERTKLAGIAPAATANASDAALRDRASHTGAQPIATVTGLQAALDGKATAAQGAKADTAVQPGADVSVLAESADAKILTAAERTKLAGIAPAATANASDAALRDRASHTGAQPIATVTGLQAALDGKATAAQGARADTALQPGADVSVLVETADAKILTAAERTKLAGIAPAATANASDAALRDRASHTGAQPIATVTGLQAALDGKATAAQGAKADTAVQPAALAAEESRARAAEALIASGQRPGDLASAYAPELTGAVGSTTAYDASAAVVDADLGAAIRLTTATHVAPRAPLAIEPGRVYQARWVSKRLTDPSDPSGDAVEIGIRWLTEAQTGVAGGAGNRVVETMPLTVAMGVQRRAATFSADVAGTDYPIPAAARYGRPWLRSYGVDHVTLAGRVELVDITEAWLADRAAAAAVQPADIAPDLAKLAGIAPGATANASDAALRDRASHTGAQPITSVTGLSDSLAGLAQARLDGDATEAAARAAADADQVARLDAHEPRLLPAFMGLFFQALPPESGYSGALTDQAGAVCFYIGYDGTLIPVRLAPLQITFPAETEARLNPAFVGAFFVSLPPESGYAGALTDLAGAVSYYIGLDGTLIPVKLAPLEITLPAGCVGAPALAPEVAGLLSAPGLRANGAYLVSTYLVGYDRRVRSIRRSDGQVFELTPSGNWTDPQILDDDTVVMMQVTDGRAYCCDAAGGDLRPVVPGPTIWCWGDSQTQGVNGPAFAWPTRVGSALGRTVIEQGRPGQPTRMVLAAFTGACGLTLDGNAIPASGPVSITAVADAGDGPNFPITALDPAPMAITLAGVAGTLAASSYAPLVATFTRAAPGDPVAVPPGTQFTTDLGMQSRGDIVIWRTGRNNGLPNLMPYARPQIAQAMAYLTPLVRQFLVVGMMTKSDGTEQSGSLAYTQITAFNAALAADYGAVTFDGAGMPTGGGRFVDILPWLVTHGLAAVGLSPTAQDLADIAAGNVPSALMDDDKLHLSIAGDEATAILLTRVLQLKGY